MNPAPNRKRTLAALALLFLVVIGLAGAALLVNVLAAPGEQQLTATAILGDAGLNTRFWQTMTAVAARATEGAPPAPRDCDELGVICLETPLPGGDLQVALPGAPPYEPTLYAQRRATLTSYATAAGPSTYVLFYATETALVSAHLGTPTLTRTPSVTPCAFAWARRDLPEITALAQTALDHLLINPPPSSVRVEAYGEECGGRFMAMSTDFYVQFQVAALEDEAALARHVVSAYRALRAGLDEYWLPARFGYLDIVFQSPDGGERRFRAMFDEIRQAVPTEGGDALALVQALGGLR